MLQARVFQNSKDALSGAPLELPAVHFVCGHSFNLRSLGENEKECPLCAPQFRSILDIKRAMRAGATEQVLFACTHLFPGTKCFQQQGQLCVRQTVLDSWC